LSKNKLFISFLKNVVRQHNDLAPAAIEQKQTLYFFLKTVVRQHNDLAPAALEQQITNHYLLRLWHDSSFKNRCASAQRLSPCGD